MNKTNKRILLILALIVWYTGSIILVLKGTILTKISNEILIGVIAGLLIGIIKAKFIFIKSAKKNIKRILNLSAPKPWDFYSKRFFIFLGIMITIGIVLSKLGMKNPQLALLVGILDLSIGTALFISGLEYLKSMLIPKNNKAL